VRVWMERVRDEYGDSFLLFVYIATRFGRAIAIHAGSAFLACLGQITLICSRERVFFISLFPSHWGRHEGTQEVLRHAPMC